MTWEKGRQLKQFGNYSYKYNNDGIRIEKTENCKVHKYILDGTNILKEIVEDTCCNCTGYVNEYLYDLDGTVCGIKHNETAYYFYKNLQGDVIAITNETGAVVARYSYDAWGKCKVESDTSGVGIANINPFRYRSYYYDSEIGMYYLQSRYYDPEVGRFINADDYTVINNKDQSVIGTDLFAYCKNTPLNSFDPSGRWVVGISFEAQAGAIMGAYITLNFFFDKKSMLVSYSLGIQVQYNASASISATFQWFPTMKDVSKTLGLGANFSAAWSWGAYLGGGAVFDVGGLAIGGSLSVGLSASYFPVTVRFNAGYSAKIAQLSYEKLNKMAINHAIHLYIGWIRVIRLIKENKREIAIEFLKTKRRFKYDPYNRCISI